MSAADSSSRRIGIIGAGPGGICTGIKLLEAGHEAFTIFEAAPAVGGTWFHNTYPGCACDIPSALYSFSFELERDWSRPYGTQHEIREYFEHCVETFGLGPHLRLSTEVTSARWDDDTATWRVVSPAPMCRKTSNSRSLSLWTGEVSTSSLPRIARWSMASTGWTRLRCTPCRRAPRPTTPPKKSLATGTPNAPVRGKK